MADTRNENVFKIVFTDLEVYINEKFDFPPDVSDLFELFTNTGYIKITYPATNPRARLNNKKKKGLLTNKYLIYDKNFDNYIQIVFDPVIFNAFMSIIDRIVNNEWVAI
jgi:hypothetical protein